MVRNVILLLSTLAVCYGATELFFYFKVRTDDSLPLVKFKTDRRGTQLWTYDGYFNAVADWDLRKETPYQLTYFANEDFNPELKDIDPARVPNAIEVVFNPQATRERDWKKLPPNSEVTLVVGDSFCFGQGVREQDRFSNRLEELVNAAREPESEAHDVFLAMCYAGADARRSGVALREFGERIPNIRRAIYAYTLNDPEQDDRLRKMQQYINDFMHLRMRGRFGKLPEPDREPTPMLQWFARQSIRQKISNDTIEWYHELHRGPTWDQTQEIIIEMDRLAKSWGVPFTLVVFPLFHGFGDYPFREIHRTIVDFATENDIEVVDLFEAFEGSDEEDFWVHPKDFHPNHRAHAQAAEFLFESISWQ